MAETVKGPDETFDSKAQLNLAKQGALQVLAEGDLVGAIDSMVSGLANDPTREKNMGATKMLAEVFKKDPNLDKEKVRYFIEGFN